MLNNRRRLTGGPTSSSLPQGGRTRRAILARAVRIAGREGLAALTIGCLAKELEMSKSGLFAHFHSKEALELATVEKAREVFANAVLRPAQASARGIERLWNLCDLWLLHIERPVFSGAYFLTGALFEYSDRPDPVAKAIRNSMQEWLNALTNSIEDSRQQRKLRGRGRADQIAFELNGSLLAAHCAYLLGDRRSFREARPALLATIRELATNAIPASAFESLRGWKQYLEKTK